MLENHFYNHTLADQVLLGEWILLLVEQLHLIQHSTKKEESMIL